MRHSPSRVACSLRVPSYCCLAFLARSGQLRAALEASLGLQRGALDTQKARCKTPTRFRSASFSASFIGLVLEDEVQRIFSCEIAELNAADTSGDHVQKVRVQHVSLT